MFPLFEFSDALRPQSFFLLLMLGRGAQDGHLDFHTAPDLCFIRLFWQYLYKGSAFSVEFEILGTRSCWFTLYKRRAEQGWLVTYLILSPHMPALFMTSLTDCWAQNGSIHGRVFTAFRLRFERKATLTELTSRETLTELTSSSVCVWGYYIQLSSSQKLRLTSLKLGLQFWSACE